MILIKTLLPLIFLGALFIFIYIQLNKDIKDTEKAKTKEEKDNVDLDEYLKNLTTQLKKAQDRASRGMESAKADVDAYTAQIEKINQIKTKKVEEL